MPDTELEIWTDGSCYPNPGPGGWAWCLVARQHSGEHLVCSAYNSDPHTTTNLMEMQAILQALIFMHDQISKNRELVFLIGGDVVSVGKPQQITIFSDSAYCVNGMNQKWYTKWKKNGWRNANGGAVLNVLTWQELIRYAELLENLGVKPLFHHVRGHSGLCYNEHCDELARRARLSLPMESIAWSDVLKVPYVE